MKNDVRLESDLIAELASDPRVDLEPLDVSVEDGVAKIAGVAGTYSARRAIEAAALRVGGLRGLALSVDVKLEPAHRRSDEAIAAAAEELLRWHSLVPDEKVHVEVEDGWVTLDGEVDHDHQRVSAEQCLRHLVGIRGLDNKITLRPHLDAGRLGSHISDALERHARRDAHHIAVDVEGGVVTLRGRVASLAERDAAVGTAFAARGVTRVVDALEVTG
jgi:osmotically-inducible protein OsmY